MGRSGGAARAQVPPQSAGPLWRSGPPRHALPEPPASPPWGAPRHTLPTTRLTVLARSAADRRILAVGGLAVGAVAVLVALGPAFPPWCAAIAIAIRLVGGGQYAVAVARRRACPNLVTWFLWGVTPMIAVAAQTGPWEPEVVVTFVLGLSPLVVTAVGLCTDRSASRLTPFTRSCAAASVAGVVVWQLTAEPALAIAFCIVADLLATLPTLQKAYRAPESEYAPPYLLSVLAMLLTLGTLGPVERGDFTAYGFPLYMLVVNVVLFVVAALPLDRVARGWCRRTLPPGRRARRFRPGRHATPRGLRDGVPAFR